MSRRSRPLPLLALVALALTAPVLAPVVAPVMAEETRQAPPPPLPIRMSLTLAQEDFEVGTPVKGQISIENLSGSWSTITDPSDIVRDLRVIPAEGAQAGKEIAPAKAEAFGAAKTTQLGPGGFVGVTFDLSALFPALEQPGTYRLAFRRAGSQLKDVAFRMIPRFDAARKQRLTLATPDGPLTIELFAGEAPNAAHNLVNLARTGFFARARVTRIEPGVSLFVQGPVTPAHAIARETTSAPLLAGTVLLDQYDRTGANLPNLVVLLAPQPQLAGKYTVAGQVVGSLDVLQKLAKHDTTGKDGHPPFRPTAPLPITGADVVDAK